MTQRAAMNGKRILLFLGCSFGIVLLLYTVPGLGIEVPAPGFLGVAALVGLLLTIPRKTRIVGLALVSSMVFVGVAALVTMSLIGS